MKEYGLTFKRFYKLNPEDICRYVEILTGKSPQTTDMDLLVPGYLIPALREAANLPKNLKRDEVLHPSVTQTAEFLGISLPPNQNLTTQQITERILESMGERAVQELENLSAVDRNRLDIKLRELLDDIFETDDSSYENKKTEFPSYVYLNISGAIPQLFGKNSITPPFQVKGKSFQNDFVKYGGIAVLVVAVSIGAWALWDRKKNEREMKLKKALAIVIIELVFLLAYNPYSVLGIEESASMTDVIHSFRTEIKEVHPDKLGDLNSTDRAKAEQRCRDLIYAYNQIRFEESH